MQSARNAATSKNTICGQPPRRSRVVPGSTQAVRQNRAFLRRAVRYLAGQAGIR
jgi:hypothetical protein